MNQNTSEFSPFIEVEEIIPADPEVVIDKYTRVDTNPINLQKRVRVQSPAIQGDVCEVLDKPVSLTFQYVPNLAFHPLQPEGKAGVLVNDALDADDTSYVVVAKNDDPTNFGEIFFQGDVNKQEQFTAAGSFGSNTYFFFFDQQGGPLLQSFHYHTSCSAPIILGAQPLSATLVGYDDGTPAGNIQAPDFGPGVNDADADTPTGPEANVGDTVVFTYVVTNPIADSELAIVSLKDTVLAPIPGLEFAPKPVVDGDYNVGDEDLDHMLDAGEQWLYVSTTPITDTTVAGQHIDQATVIGETSDGGLVMDRDPAHFFVPATLGDVDQCEVNGDVEALKFQYLVNTTAETNQDPSKAEVVFQGAVDPDGVSYVIVTDKDDAAKALAGEGKRFFAGPVGFDTFFTANQNLDDFGSRTYIHFYDDADGPLLQSVEYHTSCSQPITLGDVIGNATLVQYDGVDGSAALPPTVEPPVVDLGGVMLTTDAMFDPNNIGDDADLPTGPIAELGQRVTWTYVVGNPGGVRLTIGDFFDDNGTDPTDDDFQPVPVLDADGFNIGDANQDNFLDPKRGVVFSSDANRH